MTIEPSRTLVVDANILLGAILGRRTLGIIVRVVAKRTLVLPEQVLDEVRLVLNRVPRRPNLTIEEVLVGIEIAPSEIYRSYMAAASMTLRNAVASRNGSVADAHLLALAWRLDADIWSHDRDFAGTGWPSWSSANLVEVLDAAPALDPEA